MARTLKVLAVVAALSATAALAHEKGGDRAMGVVESVTADRIVITATDGHAVAFKVSPETRFFVGRRRSGRRTSAPASEPSFTGSAPATP